MSLRSSRRLTTLLLSTASCCLGPLCTACGSGADRAPERAESATSPRGVADLKARVEIGSKAGAEEETFGWISDVEVDSDGHIFVLDAQAHRVEVFDSSGTYIGLAAGAGAGPGELTAPLDMSTTPTGLVEVLDPALGRVTRFGAGSTGPRLLRTVSTNLHAMGFCWHEGVRVLHTPEAADGKIFHVVDSAGVSRAAFGEPYVEELPPELARYKGAVMESLNRGRVVCPSKDPAVVLLHEQVPLVRAFDRAGALLWQRNLTGFTRIRWKVTSSGWVTAVPTPGDDPRYYGAGIALLGRDTLAVSIGAEGSGGGPGEAAFEILLLSLGDGTELLRVRSPYPIMTVRGPYAYGATELPYPKVVGFAWRDLLKGQ